MHVLISWDIQAQKPEWDTIDNELRECLEGYSWVKPLSTLFIVRIRNRSRRRDIKEALVDVCKKYPDKINLLISTTLEDVSYGGWMPKTMWPKIKARTEEENDEQ
ncbi:hypothetical protein EFP84_18805 [Leptospira kmetyi]|uniref:Uncharacterized protein n=1 Tax=Leptospira kmetyi TaxID=408139 RepID=A0AAD0USA6_9LEPT|nr:hypothetical protein EFP84_18805 [Leptospira kmetyi]